VLRRKLLAESIGKILHFSDKSEPLHGGLNGMGSVNLPFVDAVAAVEDTDGRVVLIGVEEVMIGARHNSSHSGIFTI